MGGIKYVDEAGEVLQNGLKRLGKAKKLPEMAQENPDITRNLPDSRPEAEQNYINKYIDAVNRYIDKSVESQNRYIDTGYGAMNAQIDKAQEMRELTDDEWDAAMGEFLETLDERKAAEGIGEFSDDTVSGDFTGKLWRDDADNLTEGAGDAEKFAEDGKYTGFTYKHNPSNNPKVLADAVEDSKAIYGYRPNKEGSLKAFADGDWSNPDYVKDLRQRRSAYHNRNELGTLTLISNMRARNYSDEQIVRAVVEFRNQNRLSSYLDAKGNIIDQDGYDQALTHCKTYEQLRAEGKANEDIIKSATRGNPGMDASTGLYDDYYDQYSGEK